jgi:uncharacterized protein YbjT (DUF2867 family)
MKVLVLGGTGTVGSRVTRELLARNVKVKVLTREANKAAHLPEGVETEIGNLQEPETVRRVFDGVDSLFVLNATSPAESHEGLMAVSGARMAGVKRLVYLSAMNIDRAPYIPHFGAKLGIEAAVEGSGIPYTILRPNNFYQNDYWFKDAILQFSVYPQPFGGVGMSRVDVRDIAEAAAIALVSGKGEGETYNLVGPEALTGEQSAAIWSDALGRQIVYGGDDLDEWERRALNSLPAWAVFDYKLMYEHFQTEGCRASGEDLARQQELLGREPRRFEDFARETALEWLASADRQAAA